MDDIVGIDEFTSGTITSLNLRIPGTKKALKAILCIQSMFTSGANIIPDMLKQ